MASKQQYENIYRATIILATLVLIINIYYFTHPLLSAAGLTHKTADVAIMNFRRIGAFSSTFKTKGVALLLLLLSTLTSSSKSTESKKNELIITGIGGLVLYFLPLMPLAPVTSALVYLISTLAGSALCVSASILLGRMLNRFNPAVNDLQETFDQCRVKVMPEDCTNDAAKDTASYGIHFKTRFRYQHKWHDGWINFLNVFRGTMIVGMPGSGKSFSVFNPILKGFIDKHFTMLVYDFKMPDLSKVVYNRLLKEKDNYPVTPQFHCINFTDPRYSNRCNPLHPDYLAEILDCTETAKVIMENIKKENKGDFFDESAEILLAIAIAYLRGKDDGIYCDLPHLIELLNQPIDKILAIFAAEPKLKSLVQMFNDANENNAQDQLQGQIASVRLPLLKLASPTLYWILSGNDFMLDINNPEFPQILCIGNDPKRQKIYGVALSLYTFRIIKLVNEKGKRPCGLILDELPTITVKGLHNLMATARSNLVSVILGIQDIKQLELNYGDKEADVIINNCGNVFCGQVNGQTARRFSEEFGKEFRKEESKSTSSDSESVSTSYREQEVLSMNKITSLKSGSFVGRVTIDNGVPIDNGFFAGQIIIDMNEVKKEKKTNQPMPVLSDFGFDELMEEIEADPILADSYLERYFKNEIKNEWNRKNRSIITPTDLANETEKRINGLSREKKRKKIESIRPLIEKWNMEAVMEENYDRICRETAQLVEDEYEKILEENDI